MSLKISRPKQNTALQISSCFFVTFPQSPSSSKYINYRTNQSIAITTVQHNFVLSIKCLKHWPLNNVSKYSGFLCMQQGEEEISIFSLTIKHLDPSPAD